MRNLYEHPPTFANGCVEHTEGLGDGDPGADERDAQVTPNIQLQPYFDDFYAFIHISHFPFS